MPQFFLGYRVPCSLLYVSGVLSAKGVNNKCMLRAQPRSYFFVARLCVHYSAVGHPQTFRVASHTHTKTQTPPYSSSAADDGGISWLETFVQPLGIAGITRTRTLFSSRSCDQHYLFNIILILVVLFCLDIWDTTSTALCAAMDTFVLSCATSHTHTHTQFSLISGRRCIQFAQYSNGFP